MNASEFQRIESELIEQFLAEGMTQGDAQACAEGEIYRLYGETMVTVSRRDPVAWVAAYEAAEAGLRS